MPYEIVERDGTRIAVISGGAAQIRDASSALDPVSYTHLTLPTT